jgi:cytochrome d ubiquinol oxidase subunit I
MWNTEPAPAAFTVIGFPDQSHFITRHVVQIPWALGLIATHSVDQRLPGILSLVEQNEQRVKSGAQAYSAMEILRSHPGDAPALAIFTAHEDDLGYGFLLKTVTPDVAGATPAQISQAAWATVPPVATLFWSFRFMVALGIYFIALFGSLFYLASTRRLERYRWLLWVTAFSLPLPWIAAELGWTVAEVGRQPWTVNGILPTALSVSSIPAMNVAISIAGFVLAYSALFVVEMYLMVRTIRQGPGGAYAGDRVKIARGTILQPAE